MVRLIQCALLFVCLLCVCAELYARDSCKKLECQKTKQKIAKIESKMRQGYSVRAGEKMKEDLRELKRYRSKVCR